MVLIQLHADNIGFHQFFECSCDDSLFCRPGFYGCSSTNVNLQIKMTVSYCLDIQIVGKARYVADRKLEKRQFFHTKDRQVQFFLVGKTDTRPYQHFITHHILNQLKCLAVPYLHDAFRVE